ncbi:Metallo-dependent phosphatase, partial [Neoconidiobolus thromboides FSU 785]
ILKILRLLWIFNFIYHEYVQFEWNVLSCDYPSSAPGDYYKLMLLADPQLTDHFSYKQKDGILLTATMFYSDIFMLKHYSAMLRWRTPDHVYYLGDLFDGGREWEDERWYNELSRFNLIFNKRNKQINYHYVPGNHDIGLGGRIKEDVVRRYESVFGSVNSHIKVGNYTLITINSLGLVNNDESVLKFIKKFEPSQNNIVLSHIPFYREGSIKCGPLRDPRASHDRIHQGFGIQYQNLIYKRQSELILNQIKPKFIFSGDDHDACLIAHSNETVEFSVPSYSWLQGSLQPGYLLLTIPKNSSLDAEFKLCTFHTQLYTYYLYIYFLVFTICLLVFLVF